MKIYVIKTSLENEIPLRLINGGLIKNSYSERNLVAKSKFLIWAY